MDSKKLVFLLICLLSACLFNTTIAYGGELSPEPQQYSKLPIKKMDYGYVSGQKLYHYSLVIDYWGSRQSANKMAYGLQEKGFSPTIVKKLGAGGYYHVIACTSNDIKKVEEACRKVKSVAYELNVRNWRPWILEADDYPAEIPQGDVVKPAQENRQQAATPTVTRPNSDVDTDIPIVKTKQENTFVVIIANEEYKREASVPYAVNDGTVFQTYCQQTLGIPASNIHLTTNATLNDLKYQIDWLKQVMDAYGGDARVLFYYAGHGIPNEADQTAYLLPVDGYAGNVATGYSLISLYNDLCSVASKSVIVFLDACFSGAKRDGGMLASARGVAIKVKKDVPQGNLVVFSAAQGDETAYPYKEKQHGMFTYYLLKCLKDSKGDISLGKLSANVIKEVKRRSIVENQKMQTPTIISSSANKNRWESWKLVK